MMNISKFNTLENKLLKLKNRFVLLDKDEELELIVSQNATPSKKQYGGSNPWVFTEKGLYMVATILKSKNAINATFTIIETFAKIKELSKNINEIMKTEDENKQKQLALASNKILEDIIEIDSDILEDEGNGEVIETTTKFKFNLGFAKVSRSIKKIKK